MKVADHFCPKHKVKMIRKMNMWRDNSWRSVCPVDGCRVSATEHNMGHVMAFAADQNTKDLRFEVHSISHKKFENKDDFYLWLKRNSRRPHVGYMFSKDLKRVIEKLKRLPDIIK